MPEPQPYVVCRAPGPLGHRCTGPRGHRGLHGEGDARWTDEAAAEYRDLAAAGVAPPQPEEPDPAPEVVEGVLLDRSGNTYSGLHRLTWWGVYVVQGRRQVLVPWARVERIETTSG